MQDDNRRPAPAEEPQGSGNKPPRLFVRMTKKEYLLYGLVIAVGVLLDLVTKAIAAAALKGGPAVEWIPGFLSMHYAENRGIAFSMLNGGGAERVLFMTVSLLMIAGLGGYLFLGHAPHKGYGVSLALIVSGGIGNMIERIAKGYVVDFIDVLLYYPSFTGEGWKCYDFPIFNGADSFVCVGAGLMILFLILDIVREAKEKKNGEGGAKP